MITILVGVICGIIGFLFGFAKYHKIMINDPRLIQQHIQKYIESEDEDDGDDRPFYYVYVEEDNGIYYAYSSVTSAYEGRASSEYELCKLLNEKHGDYRVVVVEDEE